jgi:hypothetical protein
MPSLEHEELVELFVRDLSLAIELTRVTGKVQIPDHDTLEAGPAEIRELIPTSLRVDAVVLLRKSEPVMVILVEVQLGRDEDKPYSWPFYVAGARLRYRCPVVLLVYAVDPAIARWCARPIHQGQPGSPFVPLVVGPGQVPRVTDPEEAKAAPFRAILSALAHGGEPGGEAVAVAALAGLSPMGEDERGVWIELLWAGLNEAARKALEAAVNVENFKEQLPFYQEGLAKGTERGLDLGLSQGRKEGLRAAVETACDLLDIELTEARKAHLAGLDVAGLEALRQHLKQHRAWPA